MDENVVKIIVDHFTITVVIIITMDNYMLPI